MALKTGYVKAAVKHRAASVSGYALIVGLIGVTALAVTSDIGQTVGDLFCSVDNRLSETDSCTVSANAGGEGGENGAGGAAPVLLTIPQFTVIAGNSSGALIETLSASDADGDSVSFSVAGTDAAAVSLAGGNNSELRADGVFDAANPADANGDNVYEFIITSTDDSAGANSSTANATLTVYGWEDAGILGTFPQNQAIDTIPVPPTLNPLSAPVSTYSIQGGSLPNGLNLNTGSGQITGTPTVQGNFNFDLVAIDSGGDSYARSSSIVIVPPGSGPPNLLGLDPSLSTTGGTPINLSTGATLSDPDSTVFSGGYLNVRQTNGGSEDNLEINVGLNSIFVNSSSVLHGSTTIGTITSNGSSGSALNISLNGNATIDRVRDLVRSIRYFNSAGSGAQPSRTLEFVINDGANTSTPAQINLSVVNPGASTSFTCTQSMQNYTVPSGIGTLTVRIWGAGGGGGGDSTSPNTVQRRGAAGGFTQTELSVSPGDSFIVVVGCGGARGEMLSDGGTAPSSRGVGGWGGNANGYNGSGGTSPRGSAYTSGGGGGLSGLFIGSFTPTGAIAIAGGGGSGANDGRNGGAGGGSNGVNGDVNNSGHRANGGAQSSTTNRGIGLCSGQSGSQFQGGAACNYNGGGSQGGSGGGGWYGGGGAGTVSGPDGGGGGGSGYCASGSVAGVSVDSCSLSAGSGQIPPSDSDSFYQGGVGRGGSQAEDGGDGLVVIVEDI
ncbi:MAG: hypothetical protein Alpg2KO_18670 [Alphaproteobacteria bacterium]